jgi:hypothetical protein
MAVVCITLLCRGRFYFYCQPVTAQNVFIYYFLALTYSVLENRLDRFQNLHF